jgi:predicted solute-binding protein
MGETFMEHPVRVGAVNYLNTKPLICDLEKLAPHAELILDVPSRLADLLAEGQLDVALVPNIAIASRGPVLSVTLFSRVPWTSIRRVALDAGSRTSAALTQILLAKRYGVSAEVTSLPLDSRAEDVDADAVLLIGDRAMRACLPGFQHAFDLGQEWFDYGKGPISAGWMRRCIEPKNAAWIVPVPLPTPRRRAWDWMPVFAAAICRTSCTLTWGRANRPGCAATTHWPANWDWRGEE